MDMLINGKHISADDLAEVKNPYNGEVIDTVPVSHLNNVDLAIDAAVNAKDSIQEMSAFKISNKLYAVYEKLKDNKDELAELLTKEVGKPINESVVEVNRSIETLKLSAEEAKRIYGETVPLDGGINGKGFFAFTQRVPLGVVAAITPFNYPLNLSIHKIAPAIACKNTVIIKPPINAPLTVMKFAELVNEEFPDGVINTVTGYGSEVGDALVTSPKVDKFISKSIGCAKSYSILLLYNDCTCSWERSVSIEIWNTFASVWILLISGIPVFVSHFVTACLDTPILSPSSVCDKFNCVR